ncbi:indolepyruvate ferredoxin oxidoreductase subunit alpha [Clostridium tagluense]|uniref:thiamine pyrophosphate-dependent enzyme n=1 Tax=Clostridium tagluense TaxID=360422 RepID=UPI001CF3379D|nr:indolepyruvate ferredoxin oxidoreductase subunit alpha [Clostridium tagluense]MCB2309687.1 indolepyruvate ferredoxin oxidoreductase subunit alpha [Clostridium tagluense]MCB2314783.1 indolepyruvate ferredoxin oxidoreductase subunit alpha [Clostridium tagluense]MCB2319632.1 indolepyruvate ferredoxin oxidoreductase subunit alpha [Clostridium tagluense]MCB2324281.1 indolepyruvate ferredoxin oxidoreductase subunit alpha [Clostridium tagluense]MCB2329132.1 indolepyruvate ferredoxin oxidoreductase
MSNKKILTGNEAISRGFWEGGGMIASSYPGSPTVQILDSLKQYEEIYSDWGTNEKVAMEIAMGGSIAGARSMVSMKHVGVNIASDPFMTFTQTKTKGGLLLVVGDDPGLSSSQNEQDSRFWGKFANIPILDPRNPQEAKDFTIEGLKLSEKFHTPVLIRMMSRLCHCRSAVELGDREEFAPEGFVPEQGRYSMLPPYSNAQQYFMKERMEKLQNFNEDYEYNYLEEGTSKDFLIITSGLIYESLKELELENINILKLGMIWPLPIEKIKKLSEEYTNVIVLEEMLPFIEEQLKINGIAAKGKEYFSFTGELTIKDIKIGLKKAGILINGVELETPQKEEIITRTPMLCAGCPHRPIFHILKANNATVIGDIGCYSLGIQEPFEVHKTNISMGASLGMALGVATVHSKINKQKPIVATIGDGTFFHSGMTGFIQLAKTTENITVIIMDNRTTAMTGGQNTPTTGDYFKEEPGYHVSIPDILKSFGIVDITVADQFKYKETKEIINTAMKRSGLSVVITTRPCALNFKIKSPHFYVDEDICISCRSCLRSNCPPISMKMYPRKEKKNSYINPDMCVGCSVCSQVCPVGAIKCSSENMQKGVK